MSVQPSVVGESRSVRGDEPEGGDVESDQAGLEETESAEHVRTQFLRRVAHDIASPTGVTLTVLEELAAADKPRPELIAMARRSLRRLMRLSEQLALVAEMETGELVPELSPVDLRALAKQALDEAVAIDGRKDVVTAADLPAAPLVVEADGRLLATIVREIIGNALKLASSRVELTVSAKDGKASIRVDDDGPGFPEESLKMLGKRFVKRGAARGLGLSLSMGMEILRGHGGSITTHTSLLPPGRRGNVGAGVVVSLPFKGA